MLMDRELVMLMVMMCCYSASSVIFDGLLECVSFLLLSLCCLLAAFHSLTWSVSAYIFYALFSMQFLCLHRLSVAEDSVFSLYSLLLSRCLMPASAFFCFPWILNGIQWDLGEIITTTNRWTDYFMHDIVPQTREQDTTENSNRLQSSAAL